jgi:histidine ammonia-lyase
MAVAADNALPLLIGDDPIAIADVAAVARAGRPVRLGPDVADRVAAGRRALERVAGSDRPTYGVNTGFGQLASVRIPPADQERLQLNLVRSHACGVGEPLPDDVVRAMLLLLANSLAKGHSGVRPVTLEAVLGVLGAGIVPVVPSRGSVGSSGDLAPLAHCALTLVGEGPARVDGVERPAAEALAGAGLEPLVLASKEGLAILNGTHLMAAAGALAVADLDRLCAAAELAAATGVDALLCSHRPFDPRVHRLRNQPGQIATAARLRDALAGSTIVAGHAGCARVQDPYTLRCIPQVLGAIRDAVDVLRTTVSRELDAVTDNPLVFADGGEPEAISAGNFHGQPLSLVLDLAAIATAELAAFSERRTYALLSPGPADLPPFLAAEPGIESGLMILQYAAAALVAELQVLAHPAGPHNIPTSAGMEDYNSMGATAALKLRAGIALAFRVVAIELVCAVQALEHHRPLRSGAGVEEAAARLRTIVAPLTHDRSTAAELESLAAALAAGLLDGIAA